jgi:hypothetical protein
MQAFAGFASYFAAAEAGHTLVCGVLFTNTAVIPRAIGPMHRCNLQVGIHVSYSKVQSRVFHFPALFVVRCRFIH